MLRRHSHRTRCLERDSHGTVTRSHATCVHSAVLESQIDYNDENNATSQSCRYCIEYHILPARLSQQRQLVCADHRPGLRVRCWIRSGNELAIACLPAWISWTAGPHQRRGENASGRRYEAHPDLRSPPCLSFRLLYHHFHLHHCLCLACDPRVTPIVVGVPPNNPQS